MKTYCPYPDCKAIYEIASGDKLSLFNANCPKCNRSGRVKPLEIIDKLIAKEEKINRANLNCSNTGHNGFNVLLEDIRSLWNVGSIFRTADAIAVSKIYLCGITGCPPRSEISKTALGAEQDIPWTYMPFALDAINILKKAGTTIFGLERNDQSVDLVTFLKKQSIKKPFCLVVGNEVAGLSPEIIQSCDYLCELPMKGKKESLNVASAFAIAAYFMNEFI